MLNIKDYFIRLWVEAQLQNIQNIISLLEKNSKAVAIDIGCGDGRVSAEYLKRIHAFKMVGIDGVPEKLRMAKKNGVHQVVQQNLEKKWDIPSAKFDVAVSNQVIEHIANLDLFISEIYRILKPGGYCVISTENLASWHNIIALVLGMQDFSHHLLTKVHVGNPLSPHHNERTCSWSGEANCGIDDSAFPHIKIPTYRSLRSIFEAYGFVFEQGAGSGYYPCSGLFGKTMSGIDPYHSHFITVKMRKPRTIL